MAAVACGGLAMAWSGQPVWGSVAALWGGHAAWTAWKARRDGAQTWPWLEVREESASLAVGYRDMTVSVALPDVQQLRLQYRQGRLASLLLKTQAGQQLRIEGYERMQQLADMLLRLVPPQRVVRARWYHR